VGYSGSGFVGGFDADGDRVAWTFAADAGTYRMSIRYRSQYGPKGFAGAIDGGSFSGTFPETVAFASHDAGIVNLAAGSHTMHVGGGWNYYSIDSVTLATETPAPPAAVPAVPVDPAATPLARALLARIAGGYGTATLSGQHGMSDLATIQSWAGELPAIVEGDLMDYSPSRVERQGLPANLAEGYRDRFADGHLVSLAWHWNAPTGLVDSGSQPWWRGFYTEATTFDVAAAMANPTGADHALLLRDIDAIAVQLEKFAAADVPVLWRPLHEAEGGWFWWGAKGPDAFKQLWRLTYDRLVNHHGLHNLVWVLTSEDPAWYPGHDVVDVVGIDAYPGNTSDTLSGRWGSLLSRFDGIKPIALTEFGGVPDIDAMRLIGAEEVQTAVVAIGNDIEASILAASVLLELGVPRVWAKAVSDRHGRILGRLGVHRVVFPERDMGDRVAHGLVGLTLDFVLIGADFAMAETTAPKEALGRSLAEVGLRSRYDVTVVCTKAPGGRFTLTGPDTVLQPDDILLVIGEKENVERFSQLD
jgi:mannan endo-1,4-beta-mannosidase